MRCGVLYIATGENHRREAFANAEASRPWLQGAELLLITDQSNRIPHPGPFTAIKEHPAPQYSYRDKIVPLLQLPFEQTLFLDSDARLCAPADPLFRLLESCQVAAAQAPVRKPAGHWDEQIPITFPEYNSGVLLMRRGYQQRRLVHQWLQQYDRIGQAWDQAALRTALWQRQQRGLRFSTLPPEANLRTTKPWLAGKGSPVFIVHGRVPASEWPVLLDYLNGNIERFRTQAEWLQLHPHSAVRSQMPPAPIRS